jgi:hypothetical protein
MSSRRSFRVWAGVGAILWLSSIAAADDLKNESFTIQYDAQGIRSLKRTNDSHDTDYIQAGGSLGRLLIKFRNTANGDWRELREMSLQTAAGSSISYVLGTRERTLAEKSTPSAAVGVAGLRGLHDGLVPAPPSTGGRGGAGGGRGAGAPAPAFTGPTFSWSGSRGATQFVQYTFPDRQEVSKVEVFWTAPPQSWRVLYQDGGEWKPVAARGAAGVEPNVFTALEFAPVTTMAMRIEATMAKDATVTVAEWRVGADARIVPSPDLSAQQTFALAGDTLDWTITLTNESGRPLEIGDLAVPFNFAERTGARGDIYTRKLLRHAYVSGHGSWIYWQRSNGEGPYLVMTPMGRTKFEFQDSNGTAAGLGGFTPYVHAKAAAAAAIAAGGSWRLPVTSLTLAPKGASGSTTTYTFRFRWARDFAGVRDVLKNEHKFDVSVVPGMVVPTDLPAMFSLRTTNTIAAIEAEHPASTKIEPVATKAADTRVYRVRFSRLGENTLRIKYSDSSAGASAKADGLWSTLEFFVTEPLETVIQKRAAFLAHTHQHKDPNKWYLGVYSDWDQKNEILRSPDDRDSLSAWLTDANDDAGNARPAFLASKNVFMPNRTEIESLELYISKYLWGGMQMTDKEKYPYAIYGIPNFRANRESADDGRNGRAHVWRIYDYPHIVMLYHRMYQIAKFYPDKITHLDAATYLERAYRTAVAYWTVPLAVEKWSADAVGTMNEAFIPELIETLAREGKSEWASALRGHWEGKVDRFVNRTPNLYGSEFAFDSTGFESTGAFAKYAVSRTRPAGEASTPDRASDAFRTRVAPEAALQFMNFQLLLNMSDRGWLETTYYQLGSDYRGNLTYLLSYMSQTGGWSILDYGVHFAADPTDYLRLGYASSLSSWALVNSGTAESGYGYWFPGKANDGATGGGFMPDPIGRAWIGKEMTRGAWYYSAEEDVGYAGALRSNATIVARDPVFGELAYGGVLSRDGRRVRVVPRDGLRVRFYVVRDDQRVQMVLDHDAFGREQPVIVADDLSRVEFTLENRTGGAHETGLTIAGLPPGDYVVSVGGRTVVTIPGSKVEKLIQLPVSGASVQVVVSRK